MNETCERCGGAVSYLVPTHWPVHSPFSDQPLGGCVDQSAPDNPQGHPVLAHVKRPKGASR